MMIASRPQPRTQREQLWLAEPHRETAAHLRDHRWVFPDREHVFVTDVHADADALLASLEATGGVERVSAPDDRIRLTARGRDAVFVMGGDYFDKGPSNLRLLRVLQRLLESDARVVLLAGNHDVRTLMGIRFADAQSPRLAHLFARMGPKVVPLLREVYDEYLAGRRVALLDEAEAQRRLFPGPGWSEAFPRLVRDLVPPKRLAKELRRVREKCTELCIRLAGCGLTLPMAYAALQQCREIFLAPRGELAWLHENMTIVYRTGSFLFAHAGIDDVVARELRDSGVAAINRRFRELLAADPFELYNGPMGNLFRTKYRAQDFPFTRAGADLLHRAGVYAIVHGHKSHVAGQQIEMRKGILHFECDASLDRNTRRKSGLPGVGVAATIIGSGSVRAISSDCDAVRVLQATAA